MLWMEGEGRGGQQEEGVMSAGGRPFGALLRPS